MMSRRLRPCTVFAMRRFAFVAGSASGCTPSVLGRFFQRARGMLTKQVSMPLPLALAGAFTANLAMQHRFGTAENFFEGRFIADRSPDDVAEFYEAEDLLKLIAVHPIFFNMFMDKVDPDPDCATEETALLSLDETHFRVKLFGMEVSYVIEKGEVGDGDGDGAAVPTFVRHERFIDWVPVLADYGVKVLLWDQTWKYGFSRLEDGRLEVFHRCERFEGPWPIRLVIFFHQRYVQWACENYINGDAFGTEDIDKQQEQLACLPLYRLWEILPKFHVAQNTADVATQPISLENAGGSAPCAELAIPKASSSRRRKQASTAQQELENTEVV